MADSKKDTKDKKEETKRITLTVTLSQWKTLTLEAVEKLGSNSPSDMVQNIVDDYFKSNSSK